MNSSVSSVLQGGNGEGEGQRVSAGSLATVRCVSCCHQVSAVGRRYPRAVFSVVFSTSRDAQQSRVCFQFEGE